MLLESSCEIQEHCPTNPLGETLANPSSDGKDSQIIGCVTKKASDKNHEHVNFLDLCKNNNSNSDSNPPGQSVPGSLPRMAMTTTKTNNMIAANTNGNKRSNNDQQSDDHSSSSSFDATQQQQQQRTNLKRPPLSPSTSFSSRQAPLYDPMRIVTPFQLEAFELLPTTPMWIFDFHQVKNRWANSAGLKLWDSPSVEEFVSRDMTDMSETACARTQKLQDRCEQGQIVSERWTFYPNGKARTVDVKFTGMRLSADDDYCVLFGVVSPMARSNGRRTSTAASTAAAASSTASLGSSTTNEDEEEDQSHVHEEEEKTSDMGKLHESHNSLALQSLDQSTRFSTVIEDIEGERKCDDDEDEEDSGYENDPLHQENLRVAEIIRYLPTAVCQFDAKGNVMYQNTAAYLPEDDENDVRSSVYDSQESKDEEKDGDDISPEGVPLSRSSHSGFLRRFVDKKKARDVLEKLMSDLSLSTTRPVNIEAELYTNEKGRTQWSAIQLRRTLDPVTSEPVILFCSFDRSDAIEAERQRKARKEESEFMAIMAHEIRTPLHQVTGFIDLLECCCAPPPKCTTQALEENALSSHESTINDEQRGYIKLLRSSAAQLMTVINDVLDYSKLEAGHMKIERIPFEPMAVVEGSMAAVRQSCEEKGIEITLQYGESKYSAGSGDPFSTEKSYSIIPFRIMGDPNRLRQVLLNLLSNAIKFTETGGINVQVETCVTEVDGPSRELRRDIQFVVTDTGAGIPKSKQANVFQKYQQANTSDARKFGGTGLGLAICQSLVEKMGGIIGVDSEVGKGSSFWFSLPVETPKSAKESIKREIEGPLIDKGIAPLNVLVAEDNKINQKLVANMLKRMGHKATLVENGQEAIDIIQRIQQEHNDECADRDDRSAERPTSHCYFDAVLMDIQMPVMDGLEATRRLRLLGYRDLPIFGLTASQKRSDFEDLGFDDWLPKPILMNDLGRKLRCLQERLVAADKIVEQSPSGTAK